MKTIDRSKPVLVTGGTGYLASWIVKQLLDDGLTVHATVRRLADEAKYQHLLDIQHRSPGMLKLFEADLLNDGSFEEAMRNCELVIHTASPFRLTGIKNPEKELIQPALQGVRNVFFQAGESGRVKRIVLTSSIVAMVGDTREIEALPGGVVDEACWNTSSSMHYQPYPYSKTLAEQEAWRLVGKQTDFDLVVINPGLLLGPSLSKRVDSTSIKLMIQLFSGHFKQGVPAGAQAFADVRDVATAHVRAGFTPGASGRHLTAAHLNDFRDVADLIRPQYPAYALPTAIVPKWLFKLIGPLMGFSRKYIARNVGYDFTFNNSYVTEDLNIEFRPFAQSVNDHFNQLVNDKLIADKRLV